ncbi:hypothetical protein F4777DRAFT_591203 [Nemania sp. FL0916]|nr:hypothetical protein F4777DRAFT_591203 [Nemania sp. FL0916]
MDRERLPDLPILGNQVKWNITKVVLRAICLTLSIIDIGELIAIESGQNSIQYWTAVAYPALASFILWDIIEFIVIIVRGSTAKGVHPGAHVAVELILWLGSVVTITFQAIRSDWGQLSEPDDETTDNETYSWVRVALTQFSILGLLMVLRFVFLVRACVEVDRRKKDRRVQQLVFAIQKQGRDPQDIPLSAFRAVRELNHVSSHTVLKAISTATPTPSTTQSGPPSAPAPALKRPRSAPEERDFTYKYNFPIATVPELLESGIHPEEARNQKVLIGAFPRQVK